VSDRQLEIGRVNKVHGLRGEVVVALTSNVEGRLAPGVVVDASGRSLEVLHARPHQGKWLVQFVGIESRPEAEALGRPTLFGEPIDDPSALWVHELIGAAVVETDGTARGTVTEVHDNPASDLLVLSTGALVPLAFVQSMEGGTITVEVPEGLFDLYAE
jgi:16S rRNA processing protein RimM